MPTVEGWVLRDVANGSALIEGRRGMYEVFAGDPVPGLGRVDAIRKQDGRWVVVTSKGLIVARYVFGEQPDLEIFPLSDVKVRPDCRETAGALFG